MNLNGFQNLTTLKILKIPKPNNVPIELTVQYWFDTNKVECHPNQIDCFKPRAGLEKFKVIEEGDVSRKSYKRLHRWRYSTAAYGNNEVHLHPYKSRRISVAEALAIQSMPKNFSLPADIYSNKFKMIGNGVPYLLSKAIAELIREYLKSSKNDSSSLPFVTIKDLLGSGIELTDSIEWVATVLRAFWFRYIHAACIIFKIFNIYIP